MPVCRMQQCPEPGPKKRRKPPKSKSDGTLMANLKTAAMLFVVTVVFVITFLPAFLMVLRLVPYYIIIFYLYFANNVANPVIYSFMNQVRSLVHECSCTSFIVYNH